MRMDSCTLITVGRQLLESGNKFRGGMGMKSLGSVDEFSGIMDLYLRNNSMGV